jgi:hypothetical protein
MRGAQALSKGTVRLEPIEVSESEMMKARFESRLADDGTYKIARVAPGRYLMSVFFDVTYAERHVTIPQKPEVELNISFPVSKLTGIVTLANDGSPMARVPMEAKRTDGPRSNGLSVTDVNGSFTLELFDGGTYEVTVYSELGVWRNTKGIAGARAACKFAVKDNETLDANIKISVGSMAIVDATNNDGTPADGVLGELVSVSSSEVVFPSVARANIKGELHLNGVPAGNYRARLFDDRKDTYAYSAPFKLTAGEPTRIAAQFPITIPVTIRARDSAGNAVVMSYFEARNSRGDLVFNCGLDAKTEFTANLPCEKLDATVRAGKRNDTASVDLTSGMRRAVTLYLGLKQEK